MKAAIYNPYLDTLGGGERYTMAFAKTMVKVGYGVNVEWKNSQTKKDLEKRFGEEYENINFVGSVNRGDGYDVCFWVSDGSIPLLKARKNFLHFQFPFTNVNGRTLMNKMKLFRINEIICNSKFTKKFIDKEYGVNSKVVYPPVNVESIKPKRKKNLIVFVGRFSQLTQAKRQDVLVKVFKKLCDTNLKNWKLVLAGGVEVGTGNYVKKLKKLALGYPIEIMESPEFFKIKDLYGKAKIFWSSSGYKADEIKEPKKVEHFGISVVEAMSAGAVPLVFSAGGHKEIISHKENGFLWESINQLKKYTIDLINNYPYWKKLSEKAIKDSKVYGYEEFEKEIKKLL